METEGFVKVIAHAQTDRMLGRPHPRSTSQQHDRRSGGGDGIRRHRKKTLGRTCRMPHPTLPEAVKEAALGALKRAIHA